MTLEHWLNAFEERHSFAKTELVQPFNTCIILFNGVWYNSENNYPQSFKMLVLWVLK